MPDKFFVDSNICLYILEKVSPKFSVSKTLLQSKPLINTQIIAENINVCLKEFKLTKAQALLYAKSLMESCEMQGITPSTLGNSLHILERYGYTIFDSLIISSPLAEHSTVKSCSMVSSLEETLES